MSNSQPYERNHAYNKAQNGLAAIRKGLRAESKNDAMRQRTLAILDLQAAVGELAKEMREMALEE